MPNSTRQPLRIGVYVYNLDTVPARDTIMAHATVAKQIADDMVDRGHQVTMFAPIGSETKAKLVSFNQPDLRHGPARVHYIDHPRPERIKFERFYENLFLGELGNYLHQHKDEFDLIHLHSVEHTAHLSKLVDFPAVYTLHDPLDQQLEGMTRLYHDQPNFHLISISNNQRLPYPDAHWLTTIYNGIDLGQYDFKKKAGDHLVFAARMREEKGPDLAAQAAIKAGIPLKLFGPYKDHGTFDNDGFWDAKVAPLLGDLVTAEGFWPPDKLRREYGKAAGLLMPIRWEEPFGLVCTEAMACGTPVIGFRRGSLPEIIDDGVTGFIVDTVDEMAEAIGKLGTIDRAACRRAVEERFSLKRMTDDYENAYYSLLKGKPSS